MTGSTETDNAETGNAEAESTEAKRTETEREALRKQFLVRPGWKNAVMRPLAGDASFRRYYRLERGPGDTAVLMDAPPPRENVRPFVKCGECLLELGLSAPDLFDLREDLGFLLLEDFGDLSYTAAIEKASAGADTERQLYSLAIDALITLHRKFWTLGFGKFDPPSDSPYPGFSQGNFPPYDDGRLLEEASLLVEWYLPEVIDVPEGVDWTELTVHHTWRECWQEVLPLARDVPESLVLRDFHADNLMWLPDRAGVAACGLLDFQDAVIGPVTYDVVSLLSDARRDVPLDLERELRDVYLTAFPKIDRDAFDRSCAILGAQRSAKIIGIFTRLDRRDGKPGYLRHIPRVWCQLEAHLSHPALAPVRAWLDDAIPPERRLTPSPLTRDRRRPPASPESSPGEA